MAKSQKVKGSVNEAVSSLEQLKSLNDIQDVAQRLAAADGLCNHPHRADMILRWLTDLIKTDERASRSPQAWRLLTKSSRLISFQRLSILAKAQHPMHLVEHAILKQIGSSDLDLVRELHEYIRLLLTSSASELSSTTLAAIPAERAALLFANIASLVQRLLTFPDVELEWVVSLLSHAIAIWTGRKVSSDDNQVFRTYCWLTCSTLYNGLALGTRSLPGRKRKFRESSESWSIDDCRQQLERLMAVHVYMPARSAFNEEEPSIDLFKSSTAFFQQLDALDKDVDSTWATLPSQLEICLRCSPMRTHQQKLRERSWINASFMALVNLWRELDGPVSGRGVLPVMVDRIIERNAMVTDDIIATLLAYCDLEAAPCDWVLLSRLLVLSRHTFTSESNLVRVLAAIRKDGRIVEVPKMVSSLLKHDIIPALIQAHRVSRRLDNFLLEWQGQVARSANQHIWTRILCVDHEVAQSLEQAMTTDQIAEAARSRANQMKSLVSTKGKVKTKHHSEFLAVCTVFNAIVSRTKSTRTEDALFSIAEGVLELLLNIFRTDNKAGQHVYGSALFAALETALSLWFPLFVRSSSVTDVAAKAKALLEEPVMRQGYAELQLKDSSSREAIFSLYAARSLTSTAVNMLQAYPNCSETAAELLNGLVMSSGGQDLNALLSHRQSSMLLNDASTGTVAGSLLVLDVQSSENQNITPLSCLSGLTNVRSRAVEMLIEELALTTKTSIKRQQMLLEELISIPVDTLLRDQVERLAMLLPSAPRSSAIVDIHDVLLRQALLANIFRSKVGNRASIDLSAILHFLSYEIERSAMSDDEWSDYLESLLVLSRVVVEQYFVGKSSNLIGDGLRTLATASRSLLEGPFLQKSEAPCRTTVCLAFARPILTSVQQHMTLVGNPLALLTTVIEQFTELDHDALLADQKLCKLLEICLDSALLIAEHPGTYDQEQEVSSRLKIAAGKIMTRLTPQSVVEDQTDDVKHIKIAPAVPAFGILCLGTADLALLAFSCCRLLAVPFTARHRQKLIDSYRHAVESSDADVKLRIAHSLLSSQAAELDQCRFVVLDTTVSTIKVVDKDLAGPRQALLATILKMVRAGGPLAMIRAALRSITSILRHHNVLVNQYEIDLTLSTIHQLAKHSTAEALVFSDLCAMMITLLTQHRKRLNGRFHLVMTALQALLARLLAPRQSKTLPKAHSLSRRHAEAFSQIITLLCEPPSTRRKQTGAINLVDQDRRNRANVGSFVSSVLHAYCRLVLVMPPEESIRQALLPAVSAMLSAMQIYNKDSVKVLSAAMTDSERAILRSLVETWRTTSRWSGI